MSKKIHEIFSEKKLINKIQEKLPYLFQLAEIDNSRDGKLGMEIGSARERIVIALLIYKFGENNVKTDISITESEIDVIVYDEPISIKTVTNRNVVGVKLIWTVDAQKALVFINNYSPECDILFVHINWGGKGALYLLSKECQKEILNKSKSGTLLSINIYLFVLRTQLCLNLSLCINFFKLSAESTFKFIL